MSDISFSLNTKTKTGNNSLRIDVITTEKDLALRFIIHNNGVIRSMG